MPKQPGCWLNTVEFAPTDQQWPHSSIPTWCFHTRLGVESETIAIHSNSSFLARRHGCRFVCREAVLTAWTGNLCTCTRIHTYCCTAAPLLVPCTVVLWRLQFILADDNRIIKMLLRWRALSLIRFSWGSCLPKWKTSSKMLSVAKLMKAKSPLTSSFEVPGHSGIL